MHDINMPEDERIALDEAVRELQNDELPTDPKEIANQIFQTEAIIEALRQRAKKLSDALAELQSAARRKRR